MTQKITEEFLVIRVKGNAVKVIDKAKTFDEGLEKYRKHRSNGVIYLIKVFKLG